MNKSQWILIAAALGLFSVLYFGFDTVPGNQQKIDQQRALSAISTDPAALLAEARLALPTDSSAIVQSLESDLEKALTAGPPEAATEAYQKLSAWWFDAGQPAIAGFYAEKLAELKGGEEAWSIAGTTYSICLQREQKEKIKNYCAESAIRSLEKAASLNPDAVQHKIYLALVYVKNPPKDNPMKGILQLRDLDKQYPGNAAILTQLGRLAIETGQFDRAVQRLEQALAAEPENASANCLLAQAYTGLGDAAKAASYQVICEKLSGR